MEKTYLITRQYSLRCAVVYDIFSQICLHEYIKRNAKNDLEFSNLKTKLPEGEISLRDFFSQLNRHGDKAIVETKRNANRFLTRNYLKEIYRITEAYCYETGQGNNFKKQPWYNVSRIIVNCLSHSHYFEAGRYIKDLPVSYKGLTITASDNGSKINTTLQYILDLTEEIQSFTQNEIS